jgi:SAM-dependent methyltransferase
VLARVVEGLGPRPRIVDVRTGTGIVLEGLLPLLTDPSVHAFDLSADMVALGEDKFPAVTWAAGRVEELLGSVQDLDLVVAGQAYQWFDRPAFLTSARAALRSGGRLAVVQNSRRHADSVFLSAYEDLLELRAPVTAAPTGISIVEELAGGFAVPLDAVEVSDWDWVRPMPVGDFVGMSMSSTQAQRAVADVGPTFANEVRALAARHGEEPCGPCP